MGSEDLHSLLAGDEKLIAPEEAKLLEEWAKADVEYEAKKKAGWLNIRELAETCDLDFISLKNKISTIRAQKQERFGAEGLKTNDLIHKHPFSANIPILLNPLPQGYFLGHNNIMTTEARKQRNEPKPDSKKLPKKTKEWKSRDEFREILGLSKKNTLYLEVWRAIVSAGENSGLRYKWMKSGTVDVFCINESEAEVFQEKMEQGRIKRQNWITKNELSLSLGVSHKNTVLNDAWDEIMRTGSLDGNKIRSGEKRRVEGFLKFQIHKEDIPIVGKFIEKVRSKIYDTSLPNMTEDWLSLNKVCEAIGISHNNLTAKRLWSEVRAERYPDLQGQLMISCTKTEVFYIHKDNVDLFRAKLAELKAASRTKPNGKVLKDSIEVAEPAKEIPQKGKS